MSGLVNDARDMQQCLGRNAAHIEAYTPEHRIAFDQNSSKPQVGSAKRG